MMIIEYTMYYFIFSVIINLILQCRVSLNTGCFVIKTSKRYMYLLFRHGYAVALFTLSSAALQLTTVYRSVPYCQNVSVFH